MTALSDQIHYRPMVIATLQARNVQFGKLAPTKSASEEHGQNGLIAVALKGVLIW